MVTWCEWPVFMREMLVHQGRSLHRRTGACGNRNQISRLSTGPCPGPKRITWKVQQLSIDFEKAETETQRHAIEQICVVQKGSYRQTT